MNVVRNTIQDANNENCFIFTTLDDFKQRSMKEDLNRKGLKRFQCGNCWKKGIKETYQSHANMLQTFKCDICDLEFSYKDSLQSHIKTNHQTTEEVFKCDICMKTFTLRVNLEIHFKSMHTDEALTRIYVCDICDKKFKRKSHLKRHKIHVHK